MIGPGWTQVAELLLAFGLASLIGLERQYRGKNAGLRTQAIVGTASALFLQVSKYGFGDMLAVSNVSLDPSRVAAQIVSGIGFLGAGLIITRRGAVHGLTTAAAVWEVAAIGMAAGAGLPVLALVVTGLHFVVVIGFRRITTWIAVRGSAELDFTVVYEDGRGVLRTLLAACTDHGWTVHSLATLGGRPIPAELAAEHEVELVAVSLTLAGPGVLNAAGALGTLPGVVRVDRGEVEDE